MGLVRFPSVRAVSFDVGGTLIDPWPSVGHVYAAVAAEVGLPKFEAAELTSRFGAAWREKGCFDYTRNAWSKLVETTFGPLTGEMKLPATLFPRLYERFLDAEAWKIYDDALPVLRVLKQRGFKLAVVSNWDERLRPLLRNLQLDGFFDAVGVSAESGFHKPAPEIFRRIVAHLGLQPKETLHVGDSRREDYEGARAAGLHGLLLRRGGVMEGRDEIGTLRGIPGLLGDPGARYDWR